MAWENPVTTWGHAGQTVPRAGDFNRIEGNIQHLQDTKETPAGAQAKAEAAAAAAIAAHEDDPDPHEQYALVADLAALQEEVNTHKAASMPHRFEDGDKVYRWGFRILDGQPQFIYEEVDE